MYCSHMIAEDAADALIHVARHGTPRPATARLLCGPQPTNPPWAKVAQKQSKLLVYMVFPRHARHQKRLDSGHFLWAIFRHFAMAECGFQSCFADRAQKRCKQDGHRRPQTFNFLGFTHYVGCGRRGNFVVGHRHSAQNKPLPPLHPQTFLDRQF